jgi:hypothetical protein
MRTNRFLLWIVLGVSVGVCVDSRASVLTPGLGGMAPISEVRVTPGMPTTSSEVSVAVCGWKPASNYAVYDTELRIEGADIWLDLYWHVSGIGLQAFMQYEYTESLGTLDPGVYVLHVTNRGSMGGSASATFTVCDVPSGFDPGPNDLDPDPIDLPEPPGWPDSNNISTPSLPGFEIVHVPWSNISSIKEGISALRIEPPSPKSSDQVSVTISGWKPTSDLAVERTTLRIEGKEIWLDLYWHTQPLMPLPHESGLCAQAMQPVTIIQYDITAPYNGVPFGYTECLGTFSPGTYVLHVVNHSPMSGSASTSFTVLPSTSPSAQQPWWWLALHPTQ